MDISRSIHRKKHPVPHSEEIPVPIFTSLSESSEEEDDSAESYAEQNDSDFAGPSSVATGFNQAELNDLIRDLSLPKKSSELLASRVAEKYCLLREQKSHSITKEKKISCHSSQQKTNLFFAPMLKDC